MGVEGLVAVAATLAGTAGLAGIVALLERLRRPARMRAKVESDLALAEKFEAGDPARDALVVSARITAAELATLTLVRRGGFEVMLRKLAGTLTAVGTFVVLLSIFQTARDSDASFISVVRGDVDIEFSVFGWINFAGLAVGVAIYGATFWGPYMQRDFIAGLIAAGRLRRLHPTELPIRLEMGKKGRDEFRRVGEELSGAPRPSTSGATQSDPLPGATEGDPDETN